MARSATSCCSFRAARILAVLCSAIGVVGSVTSVEAQVSGVIRDAVTSTPIEGAIVTVQNTVIQTETDAAGFYDLPAATGTDLVIVAAKFSYFNASATVSSPATNVDIDLETVPFVNDPNYSFMSPFQCGFCHPNQFDQWDQSPMQRTGENQWVFDLYDGSGTAGGSGGFVYIEDSIHPPDTAECASCHQPERWIQNPFATQMEHFAPGSENGVSCDVCHKVAEVDESRINATGIITESGEVTFVRPDPFSAQPQVMFGVLGDTDFFMGGMAPAYNLGLTQNTCAACHEYNSDHDRDHDWEEPGSVPAQETWSEWKTSIYGADPASPDYKTCVECHMPNYAASDESICEALFPPILRDPTTTRSHDIRGTTPSFLENAVTMTASAELVGTSVDVEVSITNDQAGHSVPTGITIRNMILLVEAFDDLGNPLSHSGAQTILDRAGVGDPADGNYGGMAGKYYAKSLDDGLGGYAPIFTEATAILYDTRIPALATDTTNYSFDLPAGSAVGEVRARLIYRRVHRDMLVTKNWTLTGVGEPLDDVTPPYFGHLMEEVVLTPTVPATDVIFDGDLGGATDSPSALEAALLAAGRTVEVKDLSELTTDGTATAQTIWVCLGSYPDNSQLTPDQGQVLCNRNVEGHPIYVEGGDTWGFDAETAFGLYDGIDPDTTDDGDDSLLSLIGADSSFGLTMVGFDAAYNQDQAGSDWTDQLGLSATDFGGPDVGAIWTEGSGIGYTVGSHYASTFAPVICQSFEIGGYGGDINAVVDAYLGALKLPFTEPNFKRGDCNADSGVDIADAIFVLDVLFSGGGPASCVDACDNNDDGGVDIADAVSLLDRLFSGGTPIEPISCGPDPTVDALDCESYPCP